MLLRLSDDEWSRVLIQQSLRTGGPMKTGNPALDELDKKLMAQWGSHGK